MDINEMVAAMSNGSVSYLDRDEAVSDLAWHEHPAYKGVWLKHLVSGRETGGALSCHMVRIGPHAVLEEHVHETRLELHETLAGEGVCRLGSREIQYGPGKSGVIPMGVKHRVVAGGSGLFLLAKFSPALI
jgi:quercetin dioxygenase-like cupin family protein